MSPPKPACYSENVRACESARVEKSEWGSVGAREEGTGRVGERESKKEGGYNGVALSFF